MLMTSDSWIKTSSILSEIDVERLFIFQEEARTWTMQQLLLLLIVQQLILVAQQLILIAQHLICASVR